MTETGPPTSEERIKMLLSPERAEELDPFVIMAFMPVEPYDQVADIGCGPGFFSVPLAKHLIFGKLYALDILDEMLDALRERVREARLGNVEVLKCGSTDFPVPKESLDGVFLSFVIHEHDDPVAFLRAARDLLKPRGWCTVLEWHPEEPQGEPSQSRRMSPNELEKLSREAGFGFRSWRDIKGRQYMALLRK
jgi:ubiquinone/menaquinone biosynthesis C-methylase UbiE